MIEILIKPSKKSDKKFDAVIDGKKTVSFGSSQHSDFTKHRGPGRKQIQSKKPPKQSTSELSGQLVISGMLGKIAQDAG